MRLALIQLPLEPRSRAANIQRLLAAIEQVAAGVPAPDVILLPGSCDTGGAALHRNWTQACAETVGATMSWQAREWGVFIVAGLHRRSNDQWRTYAALFDPDGDVAARSQEPGEPSAQDVANPAGWSTALGVIVVLDCASSLPAPAAFAALAPGTLVAVPVPVAHRAEDRRLLQANLRAIRNGSTGDGLYVAVVSSVSAERTTESDRIMTTYLRGPDGAIVASTVEAGFAVLTTEIPVRTAAQAADTQPHARRTGRTVRGHRRLH